MAEDEASEATPGPGPTVRIELGGLAITVENAPDVDTAAVVALGLLRKVEPLGQRNPVGFTPLGAGQTEIRPQPDYSWAGLTWDPDE